MNYKDFIKDQNEALLSLEREKILKYCKKYNVHIPKNDKIFWANIHKARLQVTDLSEEDKELSRKWLIENGFSVKID